MKLVSGARPERLAIASLVLAGVALRLWQYLAITSLWIDEIALAENVLRTPLSFLVREPLALDQVAPPGFLAALKVATALLGPTELALRLPSLLCSLAALLLFAVLAWRTRPGWTSVFATGIFALLPALIRYGAEAKQYSTDVFLSVALTLVAIGLTSTRPTAGRRLLLAGLAGAVAVWFSAGAVFMLTGLGAALAVHILRQGRASQAPGLFGVLGLWAASVAAAVTLGLHSLTPSTREYMRQFWDPSLPRPTVLALVLLGGVVLWKTRPQAAPLFIGPTAAVLAAAAVRQYPFSGRAILFLMPMTVLAVADGGSWILGGLARLGVPKPAWVALVVSVAFVTTWHPPVYRIEDTRPLLARLAAQQQPGELVYVYYGAERAMRFYGPRVGIESSAVMFGTCHRGQPREYLRELEMLRGRPRVWMVFAHASPSEKAAMTGYLGAIGRRRGALEAAGAAAELYDLSDPKRLESFTAESYPVSESDPAVGKRFGCGHGGLAPTPAEWKQRPGS